MLTYFLDADQGIGRSQPVDFPDISGRATSIGMEPVPSGLFRTDLGWS
jgi:hypothetical protein